MIDPVTVYAKVPNRVALVHPLLTVCAVAILVASVAAAAYAKNLAKVGFMMVSFGCFLAALSLTAVKECADNQTVREYECVNRT